MEEKKIVAHERDEKAASREDRRTQMLQKLVKAGLTEEQAAAVVESKLRGNLKEGHKGRHDANNVGIGIVNSNAGGGAFGGTLGMSKGEMERRRTEEKLDALAGARARLRHVTGYERRDWSLLRYAGVSRFRFIGGDTR